jgi:hypothetical protein
VGTKFEVDSSVSCCKRGRTFISIHLTMGMNFEVFCSQGRLYNSTVLARFSRQKIGDCFGCCK